MTRRARQAAVRRRGGALAPLVFLVGLAACGRFASPRDETARVVSCKAREIAITGYAESGTERSWTATCGGQRYNCTKFYGKSGATFNAAATCTLDAISGSDTYASRRERPARATGLAKISFPRSAAGFVFGDTTAEVMKACEAAGHTWAQTDATHASCDGAASDIGWPTHASVELCDGRLCTLALSARVQGDDVDAWRKSHGELAETFAKIYGAPARATEIPDACWGEAMRSCYVEGRARESATWGWLTGETMIIQLSGDAAGGRAPGLKLVFRAPRREPRAAAEAQSQPDGAALLRAKELFADGIAAFEAGRSEEALEDFRRSRAAYPSSKNTLNAAVCLQRLGRLDEALDAYEDVLTTFSGELDSHEREVIASTTAALKPQVGGLEISANVAATLVIDGRQRGTLPLARPLSITAGARRILLLKESYAPFERTIVVTAGSVVKLDVGLTPATPTPTRGQ